ncbi:Probable alpha,alpha-trehalose-phosphate synthase [UDP-forming] 7 [Dionaea muscipula]
MMSKSYTNLLDLVTGDFQSMKLEKKRIPRVITVPGNVSKLAELEQARSVSSDHNPPPSSITQPQEEDRMIIVVNQLPINARRNLDGSGWILSWDEDSLILHLKDGFPDDMEVIYVGSLKADIVDVNEQDSVSRILLDSFKCVATFIPLDLLDRFYDKFCKKQLWPLLHYMLPFSTDHGGRFDRSLWEDYVLVNRMFSQKVIEVINPDDDYVWIHDYHLMVMPMFLRRRFNRLRMGFFLHSPFPSSEIYRTLPVREEIIRALLNADLIGFHTFDYARHFLSCCSRMLGLEYQSKRGYLGLEYHGRTVGIKIMPVGIHMGQIESSMKLAAQERRIMELKKQFEGRTVLLGVDDMDIFKGINLKVLAMEQLLKQQPHWRGKAVLVQIANPARSRGGTHNIVKIQSEIEQTCERINKEFGKPGYEPVVYIHSRTVSLAERIAYYTIAECVVVTAVRDGMNLTPYEYVICRQGFKKSMLVVSEFIGCSPSLSGAIRVNPWNIEATAVAMNEAISMRETEKQLRHEKHYRYVSSHDVGYWARSFLQDLERNCSDHYKRISWGIGLGFGFRVVSLDPNFRKLSMDAIVSAYQRSKSRAILFDYDGTLTPQSSISKTPSQEVVSILNTLCADSRNTVFIVSGRGRESLSQWFSPCPKLGIAAEHGYFLRWPGDDIDGWETCSQSCSSSFSWLQIAEPVMQLYAEATDGSYIEAKESALVWHHHDADPDFGSAQAKELLDHLESVLANEPVAVKKGQFIVEVKPQGVSKGLVAEKVFLSMREKGNEAADFVLCIGDDRSDEDMFETVQHAAVSTGILSIGASVFACTVGQKPSKAKYYLNDTTEVRTMLQSLAEFSQLSVSPP